jgi:hypothetical protein
VLAAAVDPGAPRAPGGARVATAETAAAQGEETGTEDGAAAVTAGDASGRPLPPWLRQPRTQLVVGFLTLAIIVALVAPLLLRPPEDVTVRLDQAATPGAPTAPAGTPGGGGTPGGAAIPAATPRGLRTAYDDNFRSSQSSWPNNPESVAWFADGGYRLAARQPGQFVAIRAPIGAQFRDVVVQGTFRKVAGPAGGGYGLIVRDTGAGARDGVNQMGRFYVFEVGDKGEYGIWRRDGDKWVDIVPWTAAPAVNAGNGSNTLNVQAIGTQLTFSINGQRVATQTDGALQEGSVGIFVGGDGNEVVIERFAVQVPGT